MATVIDEAAETVSQHNSPDAMMSGRMADAVKGKGFIAGVVKNGKRVLAPTEDPIEIMSDSMKAENALKQAVKAGFATPDMIMKNATTNPQFAEFMGALTTQSPAAQSMGAFVAQLQSEIYGITGKNITLTSPNTSGLVPVDLTAPSRLIYPVYTPMRNKIPRVAGQGTSRQSKTIEAISGSGQSTAPVLDMSLSELNGGSFSSFPLSMPSAGVQISSNMNVPYRFSGLSESLSWLAQFSGQGFEDISALANLVLLQEFMLNEEYEDLGATSITTSAPTIVSAVLRANGATETPITATGTNLFVAVTGTNFYGETVMSTVVQATGTYSTGTQVADIVVTNIPAGLQSLNVYAAAATSAPTRTGMWLQVSGVGGVKYTLQGTQATSGTNPPTADSGSSGANRQEGLLSVLSGHAGNGTIYPSTWKAGYYNNKVADTLNSNVLNTALAALQAPGSFKADPSECIASSTDLVNLSNDILTKGTAGAYRINIDNSAVGSVRDGAAVSEFQNPVTRSVLKLMYHPWLTQGTSILMSYSMPMNFSRVNNVVEKVLVQDYLSISWPVIDQTFRYSMYKYGALVVNAPQQCALLQGLQAADGNGTSTPWS